LSSIFDGFPVNGSVNRKEKKGVSTDTEYCCVSDIIDGAFTKEVSIAILQILFSEQFF